MKLGELETHIWRLLTRASADRHAQWRTPALCTILQNGSPTARTVVLRACDETDRTLTIHTDKRSSKYAEICDNGSASLLFYDRKQEEQLRVQATAQFEADNVAARQWQSLGEFTQRMYKVEGAPGDAVDQWDQYSHEGDGVSNFAILTLKAVSFDWGRLDRDGHKRALLDLENGTATWAVP